LFFYHCYLIVYENNLSYDKLYDKKKLQKGKKKERRVVWLNWNELGEGRGNFAKGDNNEE